MIEFRRSSLTLIILKNLLLTKLPIKASTGDFQAYNSMYGTTNNPWNQDSSPSGSSAGAAAAITTGMSALELGSDLGGSIRWPAHCCGIFGLKTTWNLVSTYRHIPLMPELRLERNPELLVAGPPARSAPDLALASGMTKSTISVRDRSR